MPDPKPLFEVINSETGEIVKDEELEGICLTEDWAKYLIYCDIDGWYINQYGDLALLDECGNYAFPPKKYQIRWNRNED